MQKSQTVQRPSFEVALKEWNQILSQAGLSTACEWILDENLVFEQDAKAPTGVRLGFQTQFTLRPANLAQASYDFFTDFEARIVFYRLGSSGGKSICLLLCDPVFETRSEAEGFIRRNDWQVSFHPGGTNEVEEITDGARWKNRIIGGRPLADVDFCLPLATLRELEIHGRALEPGERFGVKVVGAWERWRRAEGE